MRALYRVLVYALWSNALGGPEAAATLGSLIYNPLFQLFAGVVCMFIIIAVIGEAVIWSCQEISSRRNVLIAFHDDG